LPKSVKRSVLCDGTLPRHKEGRQEEERFRDPSVTSRDGSLSQRGQHFRRDNHPRAHPPRSRSLRPRRSQVRDPSVR